MEEQEIVLTICICKNDFKIEQFRYMRLLVRELKHIKTFKMRKKSSLYTLEEGT